MSDTCSSNIDTHGRARGSCDDDGCTCTSFEKSEGHGRCKKCDHVPVKHKDLNPPPENPDPVPSHSQPTHTPQAAMATPSQSQMGPIPGYQNQNPSNMQPLQPTNMPATIQQQVNPTPIYNQQYYNGHMPPHSQFMAVQQMQQMQPPPIPPNHTLCPNCSCLFPESIGACFACHPRGFCKICTSAPRFIDLNLPQELREFDYCSPECRNRDLPRLDREAGILQDSSSN